MKLSQCERSKTLVRSTKRPEGTSANCPLEAGSRPCQPALNPPPAYRGAIQTSQLKAWLSTPARASASGDLPANVPPPTGDSNGDSARSSQDTLLCTAPNCCTHVQTDPDVQGGCFTAKLSQVSPHYPALCNSLETALGVSQSSQFFQYICSMQLCGLLWEEEEGSERSWGGLQTANKHCLRGFLHVVPQNT